MTTPGPDPTPVGETAATAIVAAATAASTVALPAMGAPLLQVEDLVVQFRTHEGTVYAVNGISFELAEGERLGLVGESGCGKSVTNLAIMRLLPKPAGRIEGGRVVFDGQNIVELREDEVRDIRGRDIAMIFQDPMTSLNPVLTIEEQMVETIRAHQKVSKDDARSRAIELLEMVGIPRPEGRLKSFPHQFSGGMRQRVMIAMALALEPKLLVADEPTTALDVTIQAQVLELLHRLTTEAGSALILITHDLGVVAGMTQRIIVMYAGFIVETATTADLFARPSHPYTVGLLHSIPRLDAVEGEELIPIEGRPPDMRQSPIGCPFAPRCAWRLEACWESNPTLVSLSPDRPIVTTGPEASHRIACHNPPTHEEALAGRPLRDGFRPAPPPGGDEPGISVVDELASAAAEGALIDETLYDAGPISAAPSAAGLPVQPDDTGRPGR
jgi:oligopeptide/dipeptide ABC transporter ATP-binding protein